MNLWRLISDYDVSTDPFRILNVVLGLPCMRTIVKYPEGGYFRGETRGKYFSRGSLHDLEPS